MLFFNKNIFLFFTFLILLSINTFSYNDNPTKVLVIYNNDSSYTYDQNNNGIQDSYELALTYAVKRGIPFENLLGLNSTRGNSIGYSSISLYSNFMDEIVNPIKNKLDYLGKDNIKYFAIMYGIPYKILVNTTFNKNRAIDNSLIILYNLTNANNYDINFGPFNPLLESSPSLFEDKGHFDHNIDNFNGKNMYLISRFEGEFVDNIYDQIYGPLYGEKFIYNSPGYYRGIGYIDNQYGSYNVGNFSLYPTGYDSYNSGDLSMAYGYKFFEAINYPYKRQVLNSEIGEIGGTFLDGNDSSIAYDAMFYGGWYNFNKYHFGFRWLPGSVATDLNSNSAAKLRDNGTTFISKSLFDGLTAGAGVVSEPYMSGTPRPEIMMYYILNGYNLAESAWRSVAHLKWMSHVIGDPIYNPMKNKIPTIDSNFDRNLIIFDYINPTSLNSSRNISVFLTENKKPEMGIFLLKYGLNSNLSLNISYNYDYRHYRNFHIDNLISNKTYFYQVIAKDPLGNINSSKILNFTTFHNSSTNLFSIGINQSKKIVEINETIEFILDSNCNSNCSYKWKLGDNFNLIGNKSFNHSFNQSGVYDIFLIISDNNKNKKVSRSIVYVLSNKNKNSISYESFNGNTTNFNNVSNLNNLSGVILEKLNFGKINFYLNQFVRGSDFDTYVSIKNNNISINHLGLELMFGPINLTFYNVSFSNPFILKNGNICFECIILNNSLNKITIKVNDLANYTLKEKNETKVYLLNSNLTGLFNINQTITFIGSYLNYTSPISSGQCKMDFFDGSYNMSYNGSHYILNKSFLNNGVYFWNMSCNINGLYNLSINDTITIDHYKIELNECSVLNKSNKIYFLSQDIYSVSGDNCFYGENLKNITFEGNNFNIYSNLSYGIKLLNVSGKFHNFKISGSLINNIDLSSSHENIFLNITSFLSGSNGIKLYNSNFNNISDSNFLNNVLSGIDIQASSNNNFQYLTINNNDIYGFRSDEAAIFNNIFDSKIYNNGIYDIGYNDQISCYLNLRNVTGSNNLPIGYYNSSVNVSNKFFSELILCNSDNSNFLNITIDSGTNKRNGFLIFSSDNNIFINITSNRNHIGMSFFKSFYNNITSSIFNHNKINGMFFTDSTNMKIINSSLQENEVSDYDMDIFISSPLGFEFINVTGSGGWPIGFIDAGIGQNISNKRYSHLFIHYNRYSNFTNITIEGSDTLKNNGLKTSRVVFSNFDKINSSGNLYGMNNYYSFYNILNNSVFNNNKFSGLIFNRTQIYTLENITLNNNLLFDIFLNFYPTPNFNTNLCNITLKNVTGSGNYPIKIYNNPINLSNLTLSQLILCNAPNSILNNVELRKSWLYPKKEFLITYNSSNLSINNFNIRNKFGKINFLKNINIENELKLNRNMNFFNTTVFINSSNLPEFNIPAIIEFENVSYNNPRILKNNNLCSPPNCNILNYTNKTFIFNVSSFSTYIVEETPTCNDNLQNQDETGIDCGGVCPSACIISNSGGGGGGGGGGSSKNIISEINNDSIITNNENISNENCISDIVCGGWRSCENKIQYKKCFDLNNCISNYNETKVCSNNLVELNESIYQKIIIVENLIKTDDGKFHFKVEKDKDSLYIFDDEILLDEFYVIDNISGEEFLAKFIQTDDLGRKLYVLEKVNSSEENLIESNSEKNIFEKYKYLIIGAILLLFIISLSLIFLYKKKIHDKRKLIVYNYLNTNKEKYQFQSLTKKLIESGYSKELKELEEEQKNKD